ncbi:MAG TPA: diaminopimelate decarboxylase [Gammaproteobacteria bacterium]|nr:diaminopimelate decarboxylase [Gammaproteobacteria bacterium]
MAGTNSNDQHDFLHMEAVNLLEVAREYGTPCYVYSKKALIDNWQRFHEAFGSHPHRICYAVKANSNLAILNILAGLQSGFDIVSLGELERVLAAQGDPSRIVFSGVGKKPHEILRALEVGIHCFNVESEEELDRLNTLAKQQNKIASIALRINPDIDARTHPYIATGLNENKFGIAYTDVLPLVNKIQSLSHLKLIGIGNHIGSQLTELSPFSEAVDRLLNLANQLVQKGFQLQHINIGGGLGVSYRNETPPSIQEYAETVLTTFAASPFEIILEPGRAIVANAGILLTTVDYLKKTPHKNFAIVDAAMNDLLRPALYNAWHDIQPVNLQHHAEKRLYDIVGPVCESADFLGKERTLALEVGDLLAILCTGAYGFSMSSNYNSRPRAAEVLVDRDQIHLIRERETIEDLFIKEKMT